MIKIIFSAVVVQCLGAAVPDSSDNSTDSFQQRRSSNEDEVDVGSDAPSDELDVLDAYRQEIFEQEHENRNFDQQQDLEEVVHEGFGLRSAHSDVHSFHQQSNSDIDEEEEQKDGEHPDGGQELLASPLLRGLSPSRRRALSSLQAITGSQDAPRARSAPSSQGAIGGTPRRMSPLTKFAKFIERAVGKKEPRKERGYPNDGPTPGKKYAHVFAFAGGAERRREIATACENLGIPQTMVFEWMANGYYGLDPGRVLPHYVWKIFRHHERVSQSLHSIEFNNIGAPNRRSRHDLSILGKDRYEIAASVAKEHKLRETIWDAIDYRNVAAQDNQLERNILEHILIAAARGYLRQILGNEHYEFYVYRSLFTRLRGLEENEDAFDFQDVSSSIRLGRHQIVRLVYHPDDARCETMIENLALEFVSMWRHNVYLDQPAEQGCIQCRLDQCNAVREVNYHSVWHFVQNCHHLSQASVYMLGYFITLSRCQLKLRENPDADLVPPLPSEVSEHSKEYRILQHMMDNVKKLNAQPKNAAILERAVGLNKVEEKLALQWLVNKFNGFFVGCKMSDLVYDRADARERLITYVEHHDRYSKLALKISDAQSVLLAESAFIPPADHGEFDIKDYYERFDFNHCYPDLKSFSPDLHGKNKLYSQTPRAKRTLWTSPEDLAQMWLDGQLYSFQIGYEEPSLRDLVHILKHHVMFCDALTPPTGWEHDPSILGPNLVIQAAIVYANTEHPRHEPVVEFDDILQARDDGTDGVSQSVQQQVQVPEATSAWPGTQYERDVRTTTIARLRHVLRNQRATQNLQPLRPLVHIADFAQPNDYPCNCAKRKVITLEIGNDYRFPIACEAQRIVHLVMAKFHLQVVLLEYHSVRVDETILSTLADGFLEWVLVTAQNISTLTPFLDSRIAHGYPVQFARDDNRRSRRDSGLFMPKLNERGAVSFVKTHSAWINALIAGTDLT